MNRPTKTQAIFRLLQAWTHPDLASLYNHDMEVQILVAEEGGTRVDGDYKGKHWHGWTDGVQTWKPFRIPMKANSEPEYEDRELNFDLNKYVEAIGMTGWDWKARLSRWVAFDFDAIAGHSEQHTKKLTDEELAQIRLKVSSVPWCSLRKSTGGGGYHVYVFLDPVPTANHTEHAALARAILGMLSGLVEGNLSAKVDACGGNMWVWHRKMTPQNEGLKLIKAQEFPLKEIPLNWRDHLSVISGARRKILPSFIGVPDQSTFESLIGKSVKIPLDEQHSRLLAWFREKNFRSWWDNDHWMLVCHTYHLKLAHMDLGMRGVFDTLATGTEAPFDHNCFSGITEILTDKGPQTFADLVSQGGRANLYVLTENGMQWIDCEVKEFGIQDTYNVDFGNKSSVRATRDHRWLIYRTKILPSHKTTLQLCESATYVPLAQQTLPEIDWEGYAHGFVFGDGWIAKDHCDVAMFGTDCDLVKLMSKFGSIGSQHYEGSGYVPMARRLPQHWKTIPVNPTKSYALGFVLGLVSADGFVNKCVQIFQSDYSHLSAVRKLALYAGLDCRTIRDYGQGSYPNSKPGYALTISTYNLTKEHFLKRDQKQKFQQRKKHVSTHVTRISKGVTERVYCAIVPKYENFTLANGVITKNCFAFPQVNGAWSVRRYAPGVAETKTWEQDGIGFTKCFLNKIPSLKVAARTYGGVEVPGGSYTFGSAKAAVLAAELLGTKIDLPEWASLKSATLKEHKDGRVIIAISQDAEDAKHLNTGAVLTGWAIEKKQYVKILDQTQRTETEFDFGTFDDQVRHLVSVASSEDCGWVMKTADTHWRTEPLLHIKTYLSSQGFSTKDITGIVGASIGRCWFLVNRPFQEEYPSGREWNRNAAKFRFLPTQETDDLKYPTWMRILNHCGRNLDKIVKNDPYCIQAGILTGGDYLKCWVASVFQEPTEPLPYLFLFSQKQGTGKSLFHEALSLLVTKGVVKADKALQSPTYNGELAGAVICVVEETDLNGNKQASNKIKEWVTAKEISIRDLYITTYMMVNTTHWIQCVPKEAWIHTSVGPRQVMSLVAKPVNVVLNGQIHYTDGFFATGTRQLVKIQTKEGYFLECTKEHLIQMEVSGLKLWCEAQNLRPNSKICLNNHKNDCWTGNGSNEDGYVLGWLLGDGSFRTDDPVLYFMDFEDREVIPYIQDNLRSCKLLKIVGGYSLAGKELKELCKSFDFTRKTTLRGFELASSEFYEGVISAMIDTDGSVIVERYCVNIYQSDESILQTLQRMLLRLGITSVISLCRDARTLIGPRGKSINAKKSYVLAIRNKENLQRLYERCKPRLSGKQEKLEKILGSWTRKAIDVKYVATVVSVEETRIAETYDVTVPDVHAFDANGLVVHNCSNDHLSCPVFPGDTRITYIHVPPLEPTELIPKKLMFPMLEKEAPDFLRALLSLQLPKTVDRLNLPVLATYEKIMVQDSNRSPLEEFIDETSHYVPGNMCKFSDFFDKFKLWLDPQEVRNWTKIRVGRELPTRFPKGRVAKEDGQFYIGNLSFTPEVSDKKPYIVIDNKLVEEI